MQFHCDLCPRNDRALSAVTALIACMLLVSGGRAARAEEIKNSIGMTLRLIDAGRFEMGERDRTPGFHKDHVGFNTEGDEFPVHPVVLTRPFYLATTEVTVRQFREFVQATSYKTTAENNPRGAVGWDPQPPVNQPRYVATFRDGPEFHWKHPGFDQTDDHPIVGVSYTDALAFCDWLSKKDSAVFRLPTEAEWEYAARAGTQTYFSFGNEYKGQIQRHANIGNVELEKAFPDRVRRQWLVDIERDSGDQHVFTAPVGSFQPNPWGLFDLHGNVWEWCADRYLDTAYNAYQRPGYQQVRKRAIDPLVLDKTSGGGDWRVIRGGSWFNAPIQCNSAVRGYFEANDAACYLGFRVARDAPDSLVTVARQQFERSEAARTTIERLADRIQERRDGRLTIELRQQRERLTPEFLAALETLDEPVDLYIDAQGNLSGEQVAGLARVPHLRGLTLWNIGPNLGDADFAWLAKHPQLELLNLSAAPKLTDGLLRHLQNHQRLELLHLESAGITDDGLRLLSALTQLTTLRLSGTASQGLALEHFAASPLEMFACNQLNDDGARLLATFPTLRDVTLSESPITGRGLSDIAHLPRLGRIDLSRCRELRDDDFEVLGETDALTAVQLGQTAAGDRAAAGLVRLNRLQELRIGSDQLSDTGMRQLCGIVSLRNLTVTADATRLTDAGFADLWRLVNLHNLGIAAPQLTGTGLATLYELPALEWMSLNGSQISDAALEHAAVSKSLKQLYVGDWQRGGPAALTDAGILNLARSRNLTRFELMRRETKVTDEGLAELSRRRPELTVSARR